jgi:predicted  nucleic acid-binding Zn-ribbon protein
LKPGHQVKDCRKPNGCPRCGGHHHQSICSNASIGSKRETNAEQGNKQKRDNEEKPATRTTCAKTKENVLLKTATATALNEDGSKSTTVRILFDTGSQRSYITDNLKTRLGLKTTKTETLQLNTFGEKGLKKTKM